MLFGLAVGLSVAAAIYISDRRSPAALDTAVPATNVPATKAPQTKPPKKAESDNRFEFYDMLPKFEVIIPEVEGDVSQDRAIEIVQDPGLYVLQAGSFSELADADRRRAELALLGIESVIQRVAIDDRTYHRVRIGPIENLDRLNLIRDQLRQADIDVLRIRLGD